MKGIGETLHCFDLDPAAFTQTAYLSTEQAPVSGRRPIGNLPGKDRRVGQLLTTSQGNREKERSGDNEKTVRRLHIHSFAVVIVQPGLFRLG